MLYFSNMTTKLTTVVQEAIEVGRVRLADLARAADVHEVTVSRWRAGTAGITPETARRMAAGMRTLALGMLDAASRLEAAAIAHKHLHEQGGNR